MKEEQQPQRAKDRKRILQELTQNQVKITHTNSKHIIWCNTIGKGATSNTKRRDPSTTTRVFGLFELKERRGKIITETHQAKDLYKIVDEQERQRGGRCNDPIWNQNDVIRGVANTRNCNLAFSNFFPLLKGTTNSPLHIYYFQLNFHQFIWIHTGSLNLVEIRQNIVPRRTGNVTSMCTNTINNSMLPCQTLYCQRKTSSICRRKDDFTQPILEALLSFLWEGERILEKE